jgi:O-antigen ligase
LVLAQSKTVWLSVILVALTITAYRGGRQQGGGIKPVFVLGLIGLMLLACLSLIFVDVDRLLLKLSLTQAGSDISTLTGRSNIWLVALQVFADAPIFGYGLQAWGPEHRAAIGMPFAFHAHNQLLQSLSVAGVVGGLSLLVYFTALIKAAWRAAPRTGGVSLGILLFIAVRCVGEAPLELTGLFSGELVTHFLLYVLLISERENKEQSSK